MERGGRNGDRGREGGNKRIRKEDVRSEGRVRKRVYKKKGGLERWKGDIERGRRKEMKGKIERGRSRDGLMDRSV